MLIIKLCLKKQVHGNNIKTAPITDYDASITNREIGIFQTICVMIIMMKDVHVKPKPELP